MCIFRTTDFRTVSIFHTHKVILSWFTKKMMFNIPKLKLCSIDPEYCMLFFFFFFWSFCHVIEDKCWKHSFKRSMRLKCTARKECIKYINKYIYLKSFIPKWYIYIHTIWGGKSHWIPIKWWQTGKIQKGDYYNIHNITEDGYALWKYCLSGIFFPKWYDILEWIPSFIFHPMTYSIFTLCVSLPMFGLSNRCKLISS